MNKKTDIPTMLATIAVFVILIGGASWYNISPNISSLDPADGSVLTESDPQGRILFTAQFKRDQLTVLLDGRNVTNILRFNGLNATLPMRGLKDGPHRLAVNLDMGPLKLRTKVSAFRVDTTPPRLTIIEPHSLSNVPGPTFWIKGKVAPGSTLQVDGRRTAYEEDGSFSVLRHKRNGAYVVEASDPHGNRAIKRVFARTRRLVKAIHLSSLAPADKKFFDSIVKTVNETELNALQLDIKDENGEIAYEANVTLAREIGATKDSYDINKVIAVCRKNDIYVIGRIVCFMDPVLARKRPEYAVKDSNGDVWRGRNGAYWLDPHCRKVWKYDTDLALDAIAKGFDEIQFDYIRFPTDGNLQDIEFPYETGEKRDAVISSYLKYARKRLSESNAFLSVDIFGLSAMWDLGIGQNISEMAKSVDYICPMLYPSHYEKGNYGIDDPNRNPYLTVRKSLNDFKRKTAGSRATVRPWLQSFSLGHDYTDREIRDEIKATEASGVKEWLLWNANSEYTRKALAEENVR